MYSKHHLVLSVLAGVALVPFVDTPLSAAGVVIGAAVLGVGVDLDHFLVARYNAGSWRALRECVREPSLVFLAQDDIFEPGEVWPVERLLTHVAFAGALVAGLYATGFVDLAVVAGVVLYVHVLADLAWDVHRHDAFLERVRATA